MIWTQRSDVTWRTNSLWRVDDVLESDSWRVTLVILSIVSCVRTNATTRISSDGDVIATRYDVDSPRWRDCSCTWRTAPLLVRRYWSVTYDTLANEVTCIRRPLASDDVHTTLTDVTYLHGDVTVYTWRLHPCEWGEYVGEQVTDVTRSDYTLDPANVSGWLMTYRDVWRFGLRFSTTKLLPVN